MSAWTGKASILAQAELKALFGKGKVFEGPEMKKGKTMSSPPRSFYYVYYFYFPRSYYFYCICYSSLPIINALPVPTFYFLYKSMACVFLVLAESWFLWSVVTLVNGVCYAQLVWVTVSVAAGARTLLARNAQALPSFPQALSANTEFLCELCFAHAVLMFQYKALEVVFE